MTHIRSSLYRTYRVYVEYNGFCEEGQTRTIFLFVFCFLCALCAFQDAAIHE